MSIARILLWLCRLALLVAIGYWALEHAGTVSINWQGYVVETTTNVLIIGGIVLAMPILFLGRVWRGVRGWVGGNPHARALQKHQRGQALLAQGMVAAAAGDVALAEKMARKARGLLDQAPMLALLEAQTAYLKGDRAATEAAYQKLMAEPGMKFLGVRGLLNQSLREQGLRLGNGNVNQVALDHARTAHGLEPRSKDVLETLLELEIAAGHDKVALDLVRQLQKLDMLTEHAARRKKAAIHIVAGDVHRGRGHLADASRDYLAAAKVAPAFVPAITRAAQFCIDQGRKAAARKILLRGWTSQPHPDIVTLWLALLDTTDTLVRVQHLQQLCRGNHVEDHLALGRISLDARLWGEARKHLDQALGLGGGIRALKMRAELALTEENDQITARQLLEQAAEAAPAPVWVSTMTGAIQSEWTAFARDNGRFDVLEWRIPMISTLAISSQQG